MEGWQDTLVLDQPGFVPQFHYLAMTLNKAFVIPSVKWSCYQYQLHRTVKMVKCNNHIE